MFMRYATHITLQWGYSHFGGEDDYENSNEKLKIIKKLTFFQSIAEGLRSSPYTVSLLDCTLKNVSFLSNARIFENVSLHGLVISSGEIKRVHRLAFLGIKTPLQALGRFTSNLFLYLPCLWQAYLTGLPNNALPTVPWNSLTSLTSLDRLDLSNNKIKTLGASDFLVCYDFLIFKLETWHWNLAYPTNSLCKI